MIVRVWIYFVVFILSNVFVNAQITPFEMIKKMKRGINLGNTLSAPYEGMWAPPVKESYFEDVSVAGFNTVRIPIRWDKHTTALEEVEYKDQYGNYTGSMDDYKVDTSYLQHVEEIINWALKYDLIPIIDVHGDKWFWESYDPQSAHYKTGADRQAAYDRFKAIWRDISITFKDYDENLIFEIMNEPYFTMNAEQVHNTNMDILSLIRITNPTRIVIVTGGSKNSWKAPLQIKSTLINSDQYLIATFHYYVPWQFTNSANKNFNDFYWGDDEDKKLVDENFDKVKKWGIKNNIPVFLGEFGADNEGGYDYYHKKYGEYGGPTKKSRELYHGYLAEAALKRGFAFAAWDAGIKSEKTIYLATTRSWVEGVKNALLGKSSNVESNISTANKITLFPNPAKDIMHIITEKTIINKSIFDMWGKKIAVFQDNRKYINIKNLPDAMYLLVLTLDNGQTLSIKFKKH